MIFRYLLSLLLISMLSSYASLTHAALDAVFANSGQPNQTCLGDGTGNFTCSDVSGDANASTGVALGDVNGDTLLDAVFANSYDPNRICLGDGTDGFTCSDVSANIDLSEDVALGDVNGDSFLDAIFANSPRTNRICLNDGTGNFICSDVSGDTDSSQGVALGHMNSDTFLDIVFANRDQSNQICLGDGTGNFACSAVSADSNESFDVALGDVNGDTLLDAVFANASSNQPNRVCLGDGTGCFICSAVSDDTNASLGVALGAITASVADLVDLTGTVETADGTGLCALVLASGQFMFSCDLNGPFSLTNLPRESNGTVKRQVYVDGFFPNVEMLQGSVDETVVMMRASTCPDYNLFPAPGVFPDSAGKWIDISGTVLLQDTQMPVCAIVLANGQFAFTCNGTGSYSGNIPLDNNGQYKLQVYADGFAPTIQWFDEFRPNNNVRMARAVECQRAN